MARECTCPEDHTVSKLGHCRDCEFHGIHTPEISQVGCSMQDKHDDGTPHDFSWATYADDRMSTGVCRCGVQEIYYDMARLP